MTLTTFNDDSDLLIEVITGDKSWVYGYDIETKTQSSRFTTIEEIKTAFQIYFEDWNKRWHKCIISEGSYFEGDKIVIDK